MPILALTQGDPAGIGPEILLGAVAPATACWTPLLIAERAAFEPLRPLHPGFPWDRLAWLDSPSRASVESAAATGAIPAHDPVTEPREVRPGHPGPADAAGALAALDTGAAFAGSGIADALVTAPVGKAEIARWVDPGFRGHTDHLAHTAGLERYGRDYLMAFLAPDLQVALLTTHLPLTEAIAAVTAAAIGDALTCLHRHAGGRIAVAGLDPHAGESGLLGTADLREVTPAVTAARARGIDAHGPLSADSLFARTRQGAFDWVLALYHDQGLIAVKTAHFGQATNWTLGLPYLRTSVDHGTAYPLAGKAQADPTPLRQAIQTTLHLLDRTLPRRRPLT